MLIQKYLSLIPLIFMALRIEILCASDGDEFFEFSDLREDRSRWNQVLRGFRQGHNFSLTLGADRGLWYGNLPDTSETQDSSSTETEQINYQFNYQTVAYKVRLSYGFHIQIADGFGYYLGTQLGSNFYESAEDADEYRRARVFDLPGILAGLTYNVTPSFRVMLGIDAHLKRLDKFYASPENAIVTARSFSHSVKVDYFFTLTDGIRVEYSDLKLFFNREDALKIRRASKLYMLGWVGHLI